MLATILLFRGETRRFRRSLAGLALIAAVVGTVVFAATAGARRTADVHDRFLEASNAADAVVDVSVPDHASDIVAVRRLEAELAAMDGVGRVTSKVFVTLGATSHDLAVVGGTGDLFTGVGHPIIVDGRAPSVGAIDEVALSELSADQLNLAVGDVLDAATMRVETAVAVTAGEAESPEFDGPELHLEVVGIARDLESLSPDGTRADPLVYGTPALTQHLSGRAGAYVVHYLIDAGGATVDADAIEQVARAAVGDRGFIGLTTGHGDSGPERAFRSIAWGLALFAAVALVAGLLALGQAVARHVQLSRDTVRDASALGMTRRQTASAIALPVTGSTSLGLLTGSLAALALSPLFPISVARRAEVDRGLELDPLVHVGGAASGILLVGLITATLAWRLAGASPATAAGRRPRGASALASPLGRLSPSAAVGVGSVAGRRLVGIRPGTAVAGAIVAVAGSVAVLVFTASHTTAVGHPAHYGWTWDAAPDLYTQEPWELVEELTHDDRVAAVGGGFCDELSLAGRPVPTCAYMTISGAIGPTLVAGRAPSSDDEVALGAGTADELGVGIGDVVRLDGTTGGGTEHRDLVVVGTSVNSTLGRDGGRPAIGAVVAPDVLTSATGKDLLEVESSNLLLDLAPSADPDAVRRALAADFPMRFPVSSEPIPPELLVQIDRVRPTLLALVGLIAVLGVIGLGHYLGLSIRQRRGELAVLRSLGFVRRQVRASVTWQALAVSSVGIVIGVPLGVVVGRWSWLAAVGNLGIVDAPTTPIVALAAVCAAMAIGTALVAVLPGLAAGRRRPAQDLRTE